MKPKTLKPKMSEAQLSRLVTDWLRVSGYFFIRLNTVRGKLERGGWVRQGEPGMADLVIFQPVNWMGRPNKTLNGNPVNVIFAELKSVRGQLRPEQKKWAEKVKKLGFEYHLIKSLEDLQGVL